MKVEEILIRDYREEDYPALFRLWQITDMTKPERDDSKESIESCNRQGGKLLLMEQEGTGNLIGSSWMTWDGRRIYLHHFCIHPEFQGKGLGTLLGERSLDWIRQKKQQVKLEVHKDNRAARALYAKLGFFAFKDYYIYMKRDPG